MNVSAHDRGTCTGARRAPRAGRLWPALLISALLLCVAGACDREPEQQEPSWLVKVGETTVSPAEFEAQFTVATAGAPASDMADPEQLKRMRLRFLEQLVEELMILERGRELGITLSPGETDRALAEIREDYPGDSFAEMFTEQAVIYDTWLEGFKRNLLVRKILASEVESAVTVTDAELELYAMERRAARQLAEQQAEFDAGEPGPEEAGDAADLEDEASVPEDEDGAQTAGAEAGDLTDTGEGVAPEINEKQRLRTLYGPIVKRRKAEAAYRTWLDQLRQRYKVEVNWDKLQ